MAFKIKKAALQYFAERYRLYSRKFTFGHCAIPVLYFIYLSTCSCCFSTARARMLHFSRSCLTVPFSISITYSQLRCYRSLLLSVPSVPGLDISMLFVLPNKLFIVLIFRFPLHSALIIRFSTSLIAVNIYAEFM